MIDSTRRPFRISSTLPSWGRFGPSAMICFVVQSTLPNTGDMERKVRPASSNYDSLAPRHDLGSCAGDENDGNTGTTKEFMPQIMWPSLYLKGGIEDSEVHQKIMKLARQGLNINRNQNM